MTPDEILACIDTNGGGSRAGISKKELAAFCGRKHNLTAQDREKGIRAEDTSGALDTGTYFHKLQELGIRGQLPGEVWDLTDVAMSEDFIEALRLYRGYLAHWGSVGERFGGRAIAAEFGIPETEVGEAKIRELFGEDVTGRIDAIIEVTDPEVAKKNTGLDLEVGIYLLDFKTAGAHSQINDYKYTSGIQGAAYLHIYNMENPDKPAKGIIFDVIYKLKTLRKFAEGKSRSTYGAFLQKSQWDDEKVIHQLVQIGKHNVEHDLANPQACFSQFKVCEFFASGRCMRY